MVPSIISSLLQQLTDRQRQVLIGRFALNEKDKPLTLAAIGAKYDITRERVRQIEAQSLLTLRDKFGEHEEADEIAKAARTNIERVGGVMGLDELSTALKGKLKGLAPHHLVFVGAVSGQFETYEEDDSFRRFFYLDEKYLRKAEEVVKLLTKYLENHKAQVLEKKEDQVLAAFSNESKADQGFVKQCVNVSKLFYTNPFGDFGLASWPEIKPATIRERIYLVIRKSKAPLHFREIARLINDYGLSNRPALVPTVHNELIKDKRFVLVGRGVYALGEQGYTPGTAREVIARILENKGALDPQDIVLAVQSERLFKPNTILANLQNKKHFERLADGRYRVREA